MRLMQMPESSNQGHIDENNQANAGQNNQIDDNNKLANQTSQQTYKLLEM